LFFVFLISFTFASIPAAQSFRFQEVTALNVAARAVQAEDLAYYAVDTDSIQNKQVTAAKLADLDIARTGQLAPDVVTTDSLAFDLVTLTILPANTVPAQSQNFFVTIPTGVQQIWPYENTLRFGTGSSAIVDAPDSATSYRIENKARGPGVILGWYPSRNGHLLRYQSSRALRGLFCEDLTMDGFQHSSDDDDDWTHAHTFTNPIPSCNPPNCVSLDCVNNLVPDQFCAISRLPQTCSYTTSVSDTTNPQEGTPVYSPSVERITINNEGLVEMWYFGSGSIQPGADVTIVITVVVLLDEGYGSGSP